ncbi:MAG: PQ-loop domain-containing transporter, partial [Patescibacteria group bacterium]|nr:PQ-loop domain-containing transporter [Patescibacteria group bacterium]
ILPLVFVPQIYVLLTARTTAGISLLFLLLSAFVQSVYLFKTIIIRQRPMIVSTLSSLIPLSVVIILTIVYRYFFGV